MRDHPLVNKFVESISELADGESVLTCSLVSLSMQLARDSGEATRISKHWRPLFRSPTGTNLLLEDYLEGEKKGSANSGDDPYKSVIPDDQRFDWLFTESYLTKSMLDAVEDDGLVFLSADMDVTQLPDIVAPLEERDFYLNGYLNISTEELRPFRGRSVRSRSGVVLAIFSKQPESCYLFTVESIADASLVAGQMSRLRRGEEISPTLKVSNFINFHHHLVMHEISGIQSRYKEFSSFSLRDLGIEINYRAILGGSGNNEIFFPHFGVYPPATSPQAIRDYTLQQGRSKNFADNNLGLQVKLSDEVLPTYLVVFFRSDLGKLLLDACVSKRQGPESLDVDLLLDVKIPIPEVETQKQIVQTSEAVDRLRAELAGVQGSLSSNPLSHEAHEKIQEMLAAAQAMTSTDDIRAMVRRGESKSVEFKQTFQYCMRSKQASDAVERSALKSIVGFMNADGGSLLLGVEDSGEIVGIDLELEKFHKKKGNPEDGFVLKLKDKIKRRIGDAVLTDLDISIVQVDGKRVCRIDCAAASEGVYLDDEHFFLRVPAATEEMKGKTLEKYIKQRFS